MWRVVAPKFWLTSSCSKFCAWAASKPCEVGYELAMQSLGDILDG
jgi:hypothetical protein